MSALVEGTKSCAAAKDAEKKLPKGWSWARLDEVCSITMGQSPASESYNATGCGEPLLNGPTEFGPEHPIPAQWTTAPTRFAAPGDVLFCVRGATTGRKNIADRSYCIGRGLAAIHGKPGRADTRFLMFLLDVVISTLLRETAGSTFPNLPGEKLEAFPVALPPLVEQKRISGVLSEQMAQVAQARQGLEEQLRAAKALPAAYLRDVFTSPHAQNWPRNRLGQVCEINPRRPAINRADEAPTTFVPMPALDAESGTITDAEVQPYSKVRKGYTYFGEGDVLFAKITPCMQNGKHAIARGLIGGIGFGTTEFHVLRPRSEIIAEWVHYFVRQPAVLELAKAHFSGAVGQQRVPEEYLAGLVIPLPPLTEQKQIAALLSEKMQQIARARHALEEGLRITDVLPGVFLRRAFNGEL
ncbi:MAG: restriction endonuclease subunit S [Tepidisphaeraceae bacterium]|jgi:type I restriction enzyme S subunit